MLIRYPGSKDQHLQHLLEHMAGWTSIVEPFAGTAAVTFGLLQQRELQEVVINELDVEMVALWRTVRDHPEPLCRLIERYEPSADDFYWIKERAPGAWESEIDAAFYKIVVHQISYSGLGRSAGSPIGGRTQTKPNGTPSTYLVGCRWSPDRLIRKVNDCHDLLKRARRVWIQAGEAVGLLDTGLPTYLDPPYLDAGPGLYHHGHTVPGLVDGLRHRVAPWVMSFDVRGAADFADFAEIKNLQVTSHLHHKKVTDVLIVPPGTPEQMCAFCEHCRTERAETA